MKKFYKIIYDEDVRKKQVVVTDYEINGFNLTLLWQGAVIDEILPRYIELYTNSGKPVNPDYLVNPLSWPICSERLIALLQGRSSKYLQLFDAPIFDYKTKKPISGYKVVNVVRLIPCLDFDKSVISFSDDGKDIISVISPIYLERQIPNDAHIFRVTKDHYSVVISEELAEDFIREKITGVELLECKAF